MLLHRLQQGGLGLGRGAVDLIGQDHVGKDRTAEEAEEPAAGGGVFLEHVGAGDVARHQVGGELHPAERELERLGEGRHHQRFGEPRHAHQEGVSAGEHGGEHSVHGVPLADDTDGDLGAQRFHRAGQAGKGGDVVGRGGWMAFG